MEATGEELISLGAKTYMLRMDDDEVKLGCKGVNKSGIENPLEIFTKVMQTKESHCSTNTGFRSLEHHMYTYIQNKEAFSYFYCKRKVMDDGIRTLPLDITVSPWPHILDSNFKEPTIIDTFHICHPEFPHPRNYEGHVFISIWHEFLYRKAKICDDKDNLIKIINETDRTKLRELSEKIQQTKDWCLSVANEQMEACIASRIVEEDYKRFLKNCTGEIILIMKKQRYWGCGLRDKNVALTVPKESWGGKNKYGELMTKLIRELMPEILMQVSPIEKKIIYYYDSKLKKISFKS